MSKLLKAEPNAAYTLRDGKQYQANEKGWFIAEDEHIDELKENAAVLVADNVDNRDPAATDDETQGFSEGSAWHNVTTETNFTCEDAKKDAAVWVEADLDARTVELNAVPEPVEVTEESPAEETEQPADTVAAQFVQTPATTIEVPAADHVETHAEPKDPVIVTEESATPGVDTHVQKAEETDSTKPTADEIKVATDAFANRAHTLEENEQDGSIRAVATNEETGHDEQMIIPAVLTDMPEITDVQSAAANPGESTQIEK